MTAIDRDLEAAERVGKALIHEARNVLTPIISAAFLLDTHAENPEKVRELAKRIEDFARSEDRLLAKMRAVLEHERLGDAGPAPADAGAPASAAASSSVPKP